MPAIDFTATIPVHLPVAPLQATSFDTAAAERAAEAARKPDSDVLVKLSPSARVRASGGLPVFADDGAPSRATDNEDRSTGPRRDERPAPDQPDRAAIAVEARMKRTR